MYIEHEGPIGPSKENQETAIRARYSEFQEILGKFWRNLQFYAKPGWVIPIFEILGPEHCLVFEIEELLLNLPKSKEAAPAGIVHDKDTHPSPV